MIVQICTSQECKSKNKNKLLMFTQSIWKLEYLKCDMFFQILNKVERCCMQLFDCEDISGDPPKPGPLWREDCSRVLSKEVIVTFSYYYILFV